MRTPRGAVATHSAAAVLPSGTGSRYTCGAVSVSPARTSGRYGAAYRGCPDALSAPAVLPW